MFIKKEEWLNAISGIISVQTSERIEFDNSRVNQIKDILSLSQTGSDLLEWADDNSVEILLDNQSENNIAYYVPRSGFIALSAHVQNEKLAIALGHELRHAWQDFNGFIPTVLDNIKDYANKIRLIEADAAAIETLIIFELLNQGIKIDLNPRQKKYLKIADQSLKQSPDYLKGHEVLWGGFCGFYSDSNAKDYYDSRCIYNSALLLDVLQEKPTIINSGTEYMAANLEYEVDRKSGIGIKDFKTFTSIGEVIEQGNYLKNIPIDLSQDSQFIGNFSKSNEQEIARISQAIKGRGFSKTIPAF